MTPIAGSSNVLIPEVRAKLSMRIAPGADPAQELDALARHLEAHVPWGAQVNVERDTDMGQPFRCATADLGTRRPVARWRPRAAGHRAKPARVGRHRSWRPSKGWRPTPSSSSDIAKSRIHASDESVDPAEIERMILSQAFLLKELAEPGSRRAP
jgi:acetylornithine deacetylase/succinyl-diaminopimelate desuccinylase-like protein